MSLRLNLSFEATGASRRPPFPFHPPACNCCCCYCKGCRGSCSYCLCCCHAILFSVASSTFLAISLVFCVCFSRFRLRFPYPVLPPIQLPHSTHSPLSPRRKPKGLSGAKITANAHFGSDSQANADSTFSGCCCCCPPEYTLCSIWQGATFLLMACNIFSPYTNPFSGFPSPTSNTASNNLPAQHSNTERKVWGSLGMTRRKIT